MGISTATELAEKTGIRRSHLSEIETGKRSLTKALSEKIAEALKLPTDDLIAKLRELSLLQQGAMIQRSRAPTRSSEDASSKLHEEPSPRRVMLTTPPPDAEALLRHLIAKMDRKEMFALLNSFIRSAEAGDATAFGKAKALIELIPPDGPAVPPPERIHPGG